jgi:hypothetical protein
VRSLKQGWGGRLRRIAPNSDHGNTLLGHYVITSSRLCCFAANFTQTLSDIVATLFQQLSQCGICVEHFHLHR